MQILLGLNSLGINPIGYSYTVSGYTPQDILIRPSGPTAAIAPAGTYVVGAGAVLTLRTMDGSDVGIDYIKVNG